MKFTANRTDLLFELDSAVSSQGADNISAAVAFEPLGDDMLCLRSVSVDYQLYQEAEISVKGLDARAPVAVKIKKLRELLKLLDGTEVEISNRTLAATLKCGTFSASGLDGYGIDDFPKPQLGDGCVLRVDRAQMLRVVKKVIHACDDDKKNAKANVVILRSRDGLLTAMANFCNHQVVVASFKPNEEQVDFQIAVPPKSLLTALDVPGGDAIDLFVSPNFLSASCPVGGWRTVHVRRIEGNWQDFPALVEGYVAAPGAVDWHCDREALLALLWRIEAMAGAEAPVDLAVAEGGTLGAKWMSNMGQASDEVAGEGESWHARVNLSRLESAIKAVAAETVSISFYPEKNFLYIQDSENPDDREIVVCMQEVERYVPKDLRPSMEG